MFPASVYLRNSFLAASAGAGMKQNCLPPGGYKGTTPAPEAEVEEDPTARNFIPGDAGPSARKRAVDRILSPKASHVPSSWLIYAYLNSFPDEFTVTVYFCLSYGAYGSPGVGLDPLKGEIVWTRSWAFFRCSSYASISLHVGSRGNEFVSSGILAHNS